MLNLDKEYCTKLSEKHHDLCVFANEMATRLNDVIIELLGDDADWANHVGSTEIPKELDLKVIDTSFVQTLWILREGANGICASNNF